MFAAKTRHIRLAGIAAAIAAALAVPAQADAACANADANPNDVSIATSERATLCLLNQIRRSKGLRGFRENNRLSLASRRHSNAMADHNFFAHGNFVGRIRSANYLRGARSWRLGENIAWGSGVLGSPEEIVDAWMHSPGHRANILSRGFREIGVGIAYGTPSGSYGDGGTYVTDFGTRG